MQSSSKKSALLLLTCRCLARSAVARGTSELLGRRSQQAESKVRVHKKPASHTALLRNSFASRLCASQGLWCFAFSLRIFVCILIWCFATRSKCVHSLLMKTEEVREFEKGQRRWGGGKRKRGKKEKDNGSEGRRSNMWGGAVVVWWWWRGGHRGPNQCSGLALGPKARVVVGWGSGGRVVKVSGTPAQIRARVLCQAPGPKPELVFGHPSLEPRVNLCKEMLAM